VTTDGTDTAAARPADPPERAFSTREMLVLALTAALIVAAKAALRVPLKIPGHSWLLVIAVLVLARGLVRKPWAGTLLGLVSGLAVTFLVPASEGPFVWAKYLAAGAALDLAAPVIKGRFDDPMLAGLAGGFALMCKLVVDTGVSLAMGIPPAYVAVGLGLAATTHAVFGLLGGALGALVLRRLERTRVPGLARAPQEAEE
jgi:hypothetical protein